MPGSLACAENRNEEGGLPQAHCFDCDNESPVIRKYHGKGTLRGTSV
jgi:hypothetical protein